MPDLIDAKPGDVCIIEPTKTRLDLRNLVGVTVDMSQATGFVNVELRNCVDMRLIGGHIRAHARPGFAIYNCANITAICQTIEAGDQVAVMVTDKGGVRLFGLKTRGGRSAVQAFRTDGLVIAGGDFSGYTIDGVHVADSSNVFVYDNKFWHNDPDVAHHPDAIQYRGTCRNHLYMRNTIRDAQQGIGAMGPGDRDGIAIIENDVEISLPAAIAGGPIQGHLTMVGNVARTQAGAKHKASISQTAAQMIAGGNVAEAYEVWRAWSDGPVPPGMA